MKNTIEISKKNNVSIGAHPSFNDPENFGRKRHNLSGADIKKLIIDQYQILENIAAKLGTKVTHIKPHGALNNMACEDLNLSKILAETIFNIDKNLIYLVPTGSKMEHAARKPTLHPVKILAMAYGLLGEDRKFLRSHGDRR